MASKLSGAYAPMVRCARCDCDVIERDLFAHWETCVAKPAYPERVFVYAPTTNHLGETRLALKEVEAPPAEVPASTLASTLKERGGRYGDSRGVAKISVAFKYVMRAFPGWKRLSPHMQWALDFIVDKVARILNGDPTYADNWHDIAGYASLVERELSA